MKTCPKCWRVYDDMSSVCRKCKKALVAEPGTKRIQNDYKTFESEVDKKVKKNLKRLAIAVGLFLLGIIITIVFVLYIIISRL
ncbi:MAG: hypothetical protein QXK37_04165 [Candidatus Woesearchaeota archaeon]